MFDDIIKIFVINEKGENKMWTCPKCNRSFRTQNQQHYCGKAPETIDEYIAEQVEEVQPVLHEIQKVIHEAIPEAEEKIS